MDRRQIATKLVLEALGIEPRLDTFDQRLIVQKAIYLAQVGGVHLGYFFRWYLKGPYSPALTKDAFAIADEVSQGGEDDDSQGWTLDEASSRRLGTVAEIVPSGADEEVAQQLELLASVHYLIDRNQVSSADARQIEKVLKGYDKNFSQTEIEEALERLRQHEFLPK
jgi:uncharacterized protein YwgA